ncbi:MAG TPA: TlpA disulfide reductase family protein [Bacilli bacterium]
MKSAALRNMLILFAIFILAGIAIYQNLVKADREIYSNEAMPKPGFMAPAISLKGLEGPMFTIGGQRNKPLLLNFWASWCGPCEEEAPDLRKLHAQYGEEFDLYAVNLTDDDTVEGAEAFVKLHKFEFPILMDPDGKASKLYGVRSIPTSFLIGRDGVIEDVIFGVVNPIDLGKKIRKLIEE